MKCLECGYQEASGEMRFCPNCGCLVNAWPELKVGADTVVEITGEDGGVPFKRLMTLGELNDPVREKMRRKEDFGVRGIIRNASGGRGEGGE